MPWKVSALDGHTNPVYREPLRLSCRVLSHPATEPKTGPLGDSGWPRRPALQGLKEDAQTVFLGVRRAR